MMASKIYAKLLTCRLARIFIVSLRVWHELLEVTVVQNSDFEKFMLDTMTSNFAF